MIMWRINAFIPDLQNKTPGNSESVVKIRNFLLSETKGFFLQVSLTHASVSAWKDHLHAFSRDMLQSSDDTAESKFNKSETAFFFFFNPPAKKTLQIRSFNKNNYICLPVIYHFTTDALGVIP